MIGVSVLDFFKKKKPVKEKVTPVKVSDPDSDPYRNYVMALCFHTGIVAMGIVNDDGSFSIDLDGKNCLVSKEDVLKQNFDQFNKGCGNETS